MPLVISVAAAAPFENRPKHTASAPAGGRRGGDSVGAPRGARRLVEQHDWARIQVADPNRAGEPMWAAVAAVLTQFDGLLAGYNDRAAATAAHRPRADAGAGAASARGDVGGEAVMDGAAQRRRRRLLGPLPGEHHARGRSSSGGSGGSFPGSGGGAERLQLPALSRADLLLLSGVGALPCMPSGPPPPPSFPPPISKCAGV